MEYLRNPLLDDTQTFNLSFYDQTIFCKSFKWRQPTVNYNLKISKVEILDLGEQSVQILQWRRPPIENDLKILKVEYLSNYLLDPSQI